MYASNVLHAARCSDVSAILSVVVCVQAHPVGGGLFGGANIDAGGRQGSLGLSGAAQVR